MKKIRITCYPRFILLVKLDPLNPVVEQLEDWVEVLSKRVPKETGE